MFTGKIQEYSKGLSETLKQVRATVVIEGAKVWISLGNEASSVEHVFEDVKLMKVIRHRYAIGEENGIPLYLCKKPKVDIEQWWAAYEKHIFD